MTQPRRQSAHATRPAVSPQEIEALVQQGNAATWAHTYATAGPLLVRALELARDYGDREVYFRAGMYAVRALGTPEERVQRHAVVNDLFDLPRGNAAAENLSFFLAYACGTFLEEGDRTRANRALAELDTMVDNRDPRAALNAHYGKVMLDYLDGRLEGAASGEEELLALGEKLGDPGFAMSLVRRLPLQAELYLGRGEDALGIVQGEGEYTRFRKLYLLAALGYISEAQSLMDDFLRIYGNAWRKREASAPMLTSLLETAVLCKSEGEVRFFLDLLAPAADLGVPSLIGFYPPASPPLILGDAALFLGEIADARAHYQKALGLAEQVACRPEAALARFSLGQLLIAHFPKDKATGRAHLAVAVSEFRDMGMQPYVAQAEEALGRLGS